MMFDKRTRMFLWRRAYQSVATRWRRHLCSMMIRLRTSQGRIISCCSSLFYLLAAMNNETATTEHALSSSFVEAGRGKRLSPASARGTRRTIASPRHHGQPPSDLRLLHLLYSIISRSIAILCYQCPPISTWHWNIIIIIVILSYQRCCSCRWRTII